MVGNQGKTTRNFAFRFDADDHAYVSIETGEIYPHITGLLKSAGLVDSRWYTDESRDRGHYVHTLTAQYDLGAIEREDLLRVDSPYKGWLAAHCEAMSVIGPKWQSIEEPIVHAQYRFGGRPDRVGKVYGATAVVEIKSGDPEPAHCIQLALQCILVAPEVGLPPETIPRYGLYLKRTGKWVLQSFPDTRKDFAKARDILKRFC